MSSPYLTKSDRVIGSPFKVDWTDIDAVKKYASDLHHAYQSFGGMVVFRSPGCFNYTICHSVRHDLYDQSWVVHRT